MTIARKGRPVRLTYIAHQCALYKIGSKSRLAEILHSRVSDMLLLAGSDTSYRFFTLPEQTCPFTGKIVAERRVQEPKLLLKRLHERMQKLICRIESPEYAHGAIKGRSYRSNAAAHTDGRRVATFDIRRFFPSSAESRVYDFFAKQLVCAPDVAKLLAKLTCYRGGLPTGSPLSPVMSIWANKPMFDELDQLAEQQQLRFTCYIDDITFSGNHLPVGIKALVTNIVRRHGHLLSERKTRFFRADQVKHITGVVLDGLSVRVPHGRFHKARAIEKAIQMELDDEKRLSLMRKLAGLLGEAAHLDPRFSPWAKRSYGEMASLGRKISLKQLAQRS